MYPPVCCTLLRVLLALQLVRAILAGRWQGDCNDVLVTHTPVSSMLYMWTQVVTLSRGQSHRGHARGARAWPMHCKPTGHSHGIGRHGAPDRHDRGECRDTACLRGSVPATTVWSAVHCSGADLRVQMQAPWACCWTGCIHNGVLPLASQSNLPLPTFAGFASYRCRTKLPTPRPTAAVFEALPATGSHSAY